MRVFDPPAPNETIKPHHVYSTLNMYSSAGVNNILHSGGAPATDLEKLRSELVDCENSLQTSVSDHLSDLMATLSRLVPLVM